MTLGFSDQSMYKIQRTSAFERCVKKLAKKKKSTDDLKEAIVALTSSDKVKLPSSYNEHSLGGNLAGKSEIHIGGRNSDLLLVYEIDGDILRLIFVGTHDEMRKL